MFWDKIAGLYDLFENIYNAKVYSGTGKKISEMITESDTVLECACGTGAISIFLAPACKELLATDFSPAMLKKAEKKLAGLSNVSFAQEDIMALPYEDNAFSVVVAGNVIHLLPEPKKAMAELERVCKPGGKLIIATYINESASSSRLAVKFLEKLGAEFKRQFDADSYRAFFSEMGYGDVHYEIVTGRMPCDIALIRNDK